jgi:hypothetical protein
MILRKKSPGGEPGLLLFLWAFLRGVLEKGGATWWFFVVILVVVCGRTVVSQRPYLWE